jgi:hypothetical protein
MEEATPNPGAVGVQGNLFFANFPGIAGFSLMALCLPGF